MSVIAEREQPTRVNVRFGAIASELIEIKSGLREGDKVSSLT